MNDDTPLRPQRPVAPTGPPIAPLAAFQPPPPLPASPQAPPPTKQPPPPVGSQPPPPVPGTATLLTGMIAVNNVSKFFGSVVAVSDVSFAINEGVTALLGPNGAGKSTLFRMLCGLTPPSRGQLTVLGANPRSDRDVRGYIGLVPQQDALFDHLTVTEFVRIAAQTHGIDPGDVDGVAQWALEQVDLADVGDKPVGQFSKGMRQRAKVAAALVNDPKVLVLDEPLTGLDPVQRRRMIALFHRLGDEGRCVLVSSHVLEEVARLGSNVLVVAQGRLVAPDPSQRIRPSTLGHRTREPGAHFGAQPRTRARRWGSGCRHA
jgi:ABC-2 type transport system ATP-binding protein